MLEISNNHLAPGGGRRFRILFFIADQQTHWRLMNLDSKIVRSKCRRKIRSSEFARLLILTEELVNTDGG